MAEYIELEAIIKQLEITPILKYGIPTYVRDGVIDLVEKQPTADVAEVVHARWINEVERHPERYGWVSLDSVVCSACDKTNSAKKPYCPNCGARMDGEG